MNWIKIKYNIRQFPVMLAFLLAVGLTACDNTTSQTDRDREDMGTRTSSGQAEMDIDSSGASSYGSEGDAYNRGGADLDTIQGVDKGVQPEDIYQEADSSRRQNTQ